MMRIFNALHNYQVEIMILTRPLLKRFAAVIRGASRLFRFIDSVFKPTPIMAWMMHDFFLNIRSSPGAELLHAQRGVTLV
jgi:hypothetical protein